MIRKIKLALRMVILLGIIAVGLLWYNGYLGGGTFLGRSIVQDRVNVLLVGTDQRSDQIKANADTLILASIDPQNRRICLLSIPRDTRVELSGHGYVKINAIAALTDLPTLQKSVAQLTGVSIAGYVKTNFAGFKSIVDTLGGITVDVEKDMYYETGDMEDGYIDLHKGLQRLNGSQALQYARFRNDALADIARTARQQVVLKAIAKETFQISVVPKLPFLVPQLTEAVSTNLAAKDILALAKLAVGFDSENVISQTLPGSFQDINGVSYWKVDPAEAKKVVQNLFLGITTDEVIEQQKVDLLTPVPAEPSKPLPMVPGNSQDPNGQESPDYQEERPEDAEISAKGGDQYDDDK